MWKMSAMNYSVILLLVKHPLLNKHLRDASGKSAFDYAKALGFRQYYMDVYLELIPDVEQEE